MRWLLARIFDLGGWGLVMTLLYCDEHWKQREESAIIDECSEILKLVDQVCLSPTVTLAMLAFVNRVTGNAAGYTHYLRKLLCCFCRISASSTE